MTGDQTVPRPDRTVRRVDITWVAAVIVAVIGAAVYSAASVLMPLSGWDRTLVAGQLVASWTPTVAAYVHSRRTYLRVGVPPRHARARSTTWLALAVLGVVVGLVAGLSVAGWGVAPATGLFSCMATVVLALTLRVAGPGARPRATETGPAR